MSVDHAVGAIPVALADRIGELPSVGLGDFLLAAPADAVARGLGSDTSVPTWA